MEFDTRTAAGYAAAKLDLFVKRAIRDTEAAIATNNIPVAVTHYAKLRDAVDDLAARMALLQNHLNTVSHELLPTMFGNQDVKTITVDDVGRVSIVDRWSASMLNKDKAFDWLRATGNGGLIIETVPAPTLGAFARTENEAGRPLPPDIFKANATPHISITKS